MSGISKAHVARLHYERDLSKQVIAARLGISRFKVARLLAAARAEGVVRFEIQEPVAIRSDVARALEAGYGLDLVVVVREPGDDRAVARAAAAWLPDLLEDCGTVGIAWGATLQSVAAALPETFSPRTPLDVVQICGAIAGLEPGTGPAELALRFADRLGGKLHALPAPALAAPAARAALLNDPAVAPTVSLFERIDLAVVGVGRGDRFPTAPADAAGHILTHIFDAGGRPLHAPAAQGAIAIGRTQLERTRVIAVASGEAKAGAVHAALLTGMLDGLICDEAAAARALAGLA